MQKHKSADKSNVQKVFSVHKNYVSEDLKVAVGAAVAKGGILKFQFTVVYG